MNRYFEVLGPMNHFLYTQISENFYRYSLCRLTDLSNLDPVIIVISLYGRRYGESRSL